MSMWITFSFFFLQAAHAMHASPSRFIAAAVLVAAAATASSTDIWSLFSHPLQACSDVAAASSSTGSAIGCPRFASDAIETIDRRAFVFLSAETPNGFQLWLARILAEYSGWICVAILLWAALRRPAERKYLMMVFLLAAATSVLAKEVAQTLGFPRPYMLGAAPQLIEHGARAGLPSTHASVLFAVALLSLARAGLRRSGWCLLGIAVATGWARIYVGVHFPMDVVAGAALAFVVVAACCMLGWSSQTPRENPSFYRRSS